MTLNIGDILTRDEVAQEVGAGGDSCFLHRSNIVVAIAMNPAKNPDAPGILLVGKGPRKERYAEVFLNAGNYVPTFIKRAVNQWEYMGDFKAVKIENDEKLIAEHASLSGRDDIWGVLFLAAKD